ncbi:MAG: hypothetical protein B7X59_00845 [Polaromonas sp. 39-63-203]|jgi:predicted Zn finger-like uncharacterized protein|uniref:DUF3426 domain-containing protein n=1 Tax=Polaromonas sp. TaxID=1869339 RepID=UPI000BD5A676|nr:DUF3426 domain-containing protein [Polaromonas sp.]OYY53866.1 MAG: hypothetical protein B7Y54_01290 [Polaromonas sp. 35-63-240]OYZ85047.1 MAG: hypothetical protein B7Y03_01070 [Polaromonas sp. 24-62-144]OZB02330.1 MAG: hypothetical protein B7X59_00845 [Polaromonas sp. 39-63-203]HQS30717.1 DUF3426 domain-containing protein [Polaromonas sp.]HQS89944.1 DUF3426 domain-containing protein [Polaromonas sp.]
MSLITRCPACGTMFKVVTDQLKVSQGWVRCGRCDDIFDASKYLLPDEPTMPVLLDTPDIGDAVTAGESPPAPGDPESPGVLPSHGSDPISPEGGPSAAAGREWSFPRWMTGKLNHPAAVPVSPLDAQDSAADFDPAGWKEALKQRQQREDGAASAFFSLGHGKTLIRPASDFVGIAEDAPPADEPPRRPDLVRRATVADAEFEEELDAALESEPVAVVASEVSFVREAERKAFWSKPLVRGILLGLSAVLVLVLALQWVLQQKDTLAVLEPRTQPALQMLCAQLGCEIQPPRRVESLVIDSSTFTKIAPDAYRLSFVLKNTGNLPVEMPALELTLTDAQDQAVVRRVVLPAQFDALSSTLAARSEMTGTVSLRVAGEGGRAGASSSAAAPASSLASGASGAAWRVAGYRVLAFYP